jgi:hypothetical protein
MILGYIEYDYVEATTSACDAGVSNDGGNGLMGSSKALTCSGFFFESYISTMAFFGPLKQPVWM